MARTKQDRPELDVANGAKVLAIRISNDMSISVKKAALDFGMNYHDLVREAIADKISAIYQRGNETPLSTSNC